MEPLDQFAVRESVGQGGGQGRCQNKDHRPAPDELLGILLSHHGEDAEEEAGDHHHRGDVAAGPLHTVRLLDLTAKALSRARLLDKHALAVPLILIHGQPLELAAGIGVFTGVPLAPFFPAVAPGHRPQAQRRKAAERQRPFPAQQSVPQTVNDSQEDADGGEGIQSRPAPDQTHDSLQQGIQPDAAGGRQSQHQNDAGKPQILLQKGHLDKGQLAPGNGGDN